ncbi:methyltransferase domain-containing protein [Nisaea acidiphila]|uniref:Methyltransferase domain-containing protein n=1 Tax=Nisaea acidiphila TaxID=1862145 RepID=A0A9J7AUG2_9PROT|nr:class I SAM-dependent methyltransferase [Nisaea acidiphila]UUX51371.1 methyltransferase domain-containing protein [Nisaea acidiphila]
MSRLREASQLMRQGRPAEAAAIFGEVAKLNPHQPELQNNLGVALKAAGRPKEAVQAYRRALKLKPDYAVAEANLARALLQTGDGAAAVRHFDSAHRKAPEAGFLAEMLDALAGLRFAKPDPALRTILLAMFERRDIDLQRLAPAALSLVLANRAIAKGAEVAWRWYREGGGPPPPLPDDPLLAALLSWTTLPDPRLEAWMVAERRRLLLHGAVNPKSAEPLFLQAMTSEYAWCETEEEAVAVGALLALDRLTPEQAILLGLYRDIASVPAACAALEGIGSGLILDRSVREPEEERILGTALSALTPIADEISEKVRDQYETHPYPRWRSVDGQIRRKSFEAHQRDRFPAMRFDGIDLRAPKLLVAGCGTGRHAIQTAARYEGVEVTAVDLSRRSLGYAARMAQDLGRTNIRFAQADILGLGALEERFDVIECSGVLHHMADPLAGWRVLRGLLKPGGLMRVALYSEIARERFAKLRAEIEATAEDEIAAEIRDRRRDALLLPESDPAAIVWQTGDFYSLSGCRDLLFHRREVRFTWPEIGAAVAELDLKLVGVETASVALRELYLKRFPEDPSATDPANWDKIEREYPESFLAMYQFWCQAA